MVELAQTRSETDRSQTAPSDRVDFFVSALGLDVPADQLKLLRALPALILSSD